MDQTRKTKNPQFVAGDIKDPRKLANKLLGRHIYDPVSTYLWERLPSLNLELDKFQQKKDHSPPALVQLEKVMVQGLNELLQDKGLYDETRFENVELPETTGAIFARVVSGDLPEDGLASFNRELLEAAYPTELGRYTRIQWFWHSHVKENFEAACAIALFLVLVYFLLPHSGTKAVGEHRETQQTGYPFFGSGDLKNPTGLVTKLRNRGDPVSAYLSRKLSDESQKQLKEPDKSKLPALVEFLNERLQDKKLYEEKRFSHVTLAEVTHKLLEQDPHGEALIRLNRLLIEDAYPTEIARNPIGRIEADLGLIGHEVEALSASHNQPPLVALLQVLIVLSIAWAWFLAFATTHHKSRDKRWWKARGVRALLSSSPACWFAYLMSSSYVPAVFAMALLGIFVAAEHFASLEHQEHNLESQVTRLTGLERSLDKKIGLLLNLEGLDEWKDKMYPAYAAATDRIDGVVRIWDIDKEWWGCDPGHLWESYQAKCPGRRSNTLFTCLTDKDCHAKVQFITEMPLPEIGSHDEKASPDEFRKLLGLAWQLLVFAKVNEARRGEKSGTERDKVPYVRARIATPEVWMHVVDDRVYHMGVFHLG